MEREDLKDYRNNKEYLKERIDDLEEAEEQVNKLTAILSDMPKRK